MSGILDPRILHFRSSEDKKTAHIAEGIYKMLEKVDMVGEEDLVGVTQALARIQIAYR